MNSNQDLALCPLCPATVIIPNSRERMHALYPCPSRYPSLTHNSGTLPGYVGRYLGNNPRFCYRRIELSSELRHVTVSLLPPRHLQQARYLPFVGTRRALRSSPE